MPASQSKRANGIETKSCVKRVGKHAIMTERLIGEGHYGKVFLAYEISKGTITDETVALNLKVPLVCKVIDRSKLSPRSEKLIKSEIQNLHLIKSDGVIRLAQHYKTHQAYYIFSNYCNGGDVS